MKRRLQNWLRRVARVLTWPRKPEPVRYVAFEEGMRRFEEMKAGLSCYRAEECDVEGLRVARKVRH